MYFITAGQTSVAFNNPTAGNYLVRVGDLSDISCQSSCTITLKEPVAEPPKCINEFGEFTITKRIP